MIAWPLGESTFVEPYADTTIVTKLFENVICLPCRHFQVMEIVCDCANARVVGEGHLGAKPLDGSDPVEQAEKIAQARYDCCVSVA